MPVPSRRLKDLIEGTVDHHASQRWPALQEVTIRWRGSYGYLTGYLSDDDDDTIELCRIQYLGDPDEWAFAIWQASTDSYAESVLLDGRPAGHPNLALDTACTLYLAGTSDHPVQPDKPLKDLRGAALGQGSSEVSGRSVNDQEAHLHHGDLVPTVPVTGRADLTDAQWAVLERLLPRGKKPGRQRIYARRQLIDGIRWRVRAVPGAPDCRKCGSAHSDRMAASTRCRRAVPANSA